MMTSLFPCLCLVIAIALMTGSFSTPAAGQTPAGAANASGGASGDASAGDASAGVQLSRIVPVAGQPVEIYLTDKDGQDALQFTITRQDTGQVVHEQAAGTLTWGRGIQWTAPQTGYYRVSVSVAGKSEPIHTRQFAVVHRDLHFMIWPPMEPQEHELTLLGSRVIQISPEKNREQVLEWRRRGAIVLGATFTGARQITMAQSDEENVEKLVSAWTRGLAEICDGIYIDEVGAYPTADGHRRVGIINAALARFRKENPDKLIYVAVAGSPLPELAAGIRAANAVALLEAYESWLTAAFATHRFHDYFDKRIDVARHTDLMYEHGRRSAAVMFAGYDGLQGGTTRAQLEAAVRHIKRSAPEMPGIAFYASGRSRQWLKDAGMRAWAEELTERYYIRPVLEVQDIHLEPTAPVAGSPVSVQVQVHNLGGMRATDVTVELFASPLGLSERQRVGAVTLDVVDVGHLNLPALKNESDTHYDYQTIAGREVPVFTAKATVSIDRRTATFQWTPPQAGGYALHAVIRAQQQVTLLDGTGSLNVVVASQE